MFPSILQVILFPAPCNAQVGAQTETELKEKKLRVEDALNATKAAVEEGIVIGGGCTLLKLSYKVCIVRRGGSDVVSRPKVGSAADHHEAVASPSPESMTPLHKVTHTHTHTHTHTYTQVEEFKKTLEHDEQKLGADIIKKALAYPLRLIANNAGVNGSVVMSKVSCGWIWQASCILNFGRQGGVRRPDSGTHGGGAASKLLRSWRQLKNACTRLWMSLLQCPCDKLLHFTNKSRTGIHETTFMMDVCARSPAGERGQGQPQLWLQRRH